MRINIGLLLLGGDGDETEDVQLMTIEVHCTLILLGIVISAMYKTCGLILLGVIGIVTYAVYKACTDSRVRLEDVLGPTIEVRGGLVLLGIAISTVYKTCALILLGVIGIANYAVYEACTDSRVRFDDVLGPTIEVRGGLALILILIYAVYKTWSLIVLG